MEQCLCSVDVGGEVYFLSTSVRGEQDETEFKIQLIEAKTLQAWEGKFGGDIKTQADVTDMDEADYIDQTRKALTRQNMGDLTFEYQLSPSKKNMRWLSWKKVVSSIKFQLGKVSLTPISSPPEAIRDVLLHSIQTVSELKGSIYRLETENDRLSSERTQALKRLEKCVVQKEQMEGDLYGKFSAILNDKKAKIRDLRDNAPGTSISAGDDDEGQRSNQQSDDVIKQESEEDMDLGEDDMDTDEERERDVSSRKRQKKSALPPSRPAQDDSIVFDEESPVEPANRSRRRRREPTSKKTSSQKPAIPKVSSTGTPSTPRTPSIRKTPSRERSQRSTEDNADDLFDEI